MNWDIVQTLVRSLLKAGAGALIARGVLQSEEAEQLIGAIVLIAGVVWGVLHRTKPSVASVAAVAFLCFMPFLLVGCASYVHQRPIVLSRTLPGSAGAASTQEIVGYEKTGFHSFLMIGQASKIHTLTKDKDYSRSLSVGSIQGQGDAELVKSLVEAGGAAAAAGAKAAVKP